MISPRARTPRERSRLLPRLPPVGGTIDVDASAAQEALHRRLDDMHYGLEAKTLMGTHRRGRKTELMREIDDLDLPPWSARKAAGKAGAERARSPRRRVQALGSGEFCLHSDEHVSRRLAQRLEHGQVKDDAKLARAIDHSNSTGSASANLLAERGIKPLMGMAESPYREIQRDVAAALYSLSISDKNKVAFMEAKALETLVNLAESPDADIRRNVAGAMYRLAMDKRIKRPFVTKAGVLTPLLTFLASENRDVHRHGIMCLRELCESKDNRSDLFEQCGDAPGLLNSVFRLMNNVDPRVRRQAGATLVALLGESHNKIVMLDNGSLPRLVALLRSRDSQLRRLAVDCLVHITKLQDIHPQPLDHCHMVRSDEVLIAIVEVLGAETDAELLLGLLKSITSLVGLVRHDAKRLKQRLCDFGLVDRLLDQAKRLVLAEQQTASSLDLVAQVVKMLALHANRSKAVLEIIHATGHERTVVLLCKSQERKVRRGAARLLGRLSTLVAWKRSVGSDPDLLPLLLSMCKIDDTTIQVAACQIIAEISELPTNRVAMVSAGVLPALSSLLRLDDSRVHRDAMRAMAALAEAVDNRVSMSYRAVESIASMLFNEDQAAQEDAIRALANIAAPAGIISESAEEASANNDDDGEQKLCLVGRYGSNYIPPDADSEDEDEDGGGEGPEAPKAVSDAPLNHLLHRMNWRCARVHPCSGTDLHVPKPFASQNEPHTACGSALCSTQ